MDIATVRKAYPQYGDLSDDHLATALHKKYYSDLPYEEFAGKIGLKAAQPTTKSEGRSAVNMAIAALSTPLRELPGIKRGIEDVVDAGAQMLVNALPQGAVNLANRALGSRLAPTAEQFNQQQAREEVDYQARRLGTGVDAGRLVGNIAGTVPLAAALPGPGATLASTALRGASTGAAVGSLNPVTNADEPFWEQKGKQAALGAVAGGVASPLLQVASRVVAPRVDAAVKYLQDRGVRPRPGQLIGPRAAAVEDKAMSAPIVGDAIAGAQRRAVEDFNRAAYNEVLKPLGQKYSGPVGRDGIAAVQDTLGKAYDDVLPNLRWKADPKFVGEFKKIAGMAQSLPPDKYTQFQRVMENELIPRVRGGTMDGISFKELESELGRLARTYASSSSADDRVLANGINEVLTSARSALERSNPKFAGQLRRINQAYATFTRVQDAAGRVGTEEGIFTPNHLLSAVRNMDKSARKGAFARGDALLQGLAENGKKVLGIKYPDSGTAGRLANMGAGAALVTNPALTLGGGLAASLPYTQTGQSIANSLLTQRSPWARPVGEAINKVSVPGGGVLGPLGAGILFGTEEEANGYYGNRR
jgi:hypothetical protein